MKKLAALGMLSLSFNATAQDSLVDAESWVRSVNGLVHTERVVLKKNAATGGTDIGLMIPAAEMLAEAGVNDKGRRVLELARAYAGQSGRKLNVLLPEQKPAPPADDCSGPGAGSVPTGSHVYIFIKE